LRSDCPLIKQGFYEINDLENITKKMTENETIAFDNRYTDSTPKYSMEYEIMANMQGINQFCRGHMVLGNDTFLNHLYKVQRNVSAGKFSALCDAFDITGDFDGSEFLADYLEIQLDSAGFFKAIENDRREFGKEPMSDKEKKDMEEVFNIMLNDKRQIISKVNNAKTPEEIKESKKSIPDYCRVIKRSVEEPVKVKTL
jgi:hypothetical protein